jgi:fructose-bisphosphate aldolase class II
MPVVGFSELYQHAADRQYGLALVNAHALPIARGALECAAEQDAPLVLGVNGDRLSDGLLPSLELMARQATIPLSLLGTRIENTEQAVRAIRLGCNALVLADGLGEIDVGELRDLCASCGIDTFENSELSDILVEVDEELDPGKLGVLAPAPSSWQQLDASVAQAAAKLLEGLFNKQGSSGQGSEAMKVCKSWHPVEHLIIYNTTVDDAKSAELAAEGRRVLDRIPGVRATWSGRAVKDDAGYRWCWLFRFAHAAVIDSYREHPDHVAYADNHFRPIAGDRVSIDYHLTGPEES